MNSLDLIITVGALIIGVMLLTGHGEVFLKGGNDNFRKKTYDETKMSRVYGIAMVIAGIATAVDSFTEGLAAKIIYIIFIIVVFVTAFIYVRKKCRINKD